MVLNKSKWDHKAKIQYLRKHNLTQPRKPEEPRKKWSSKRQAAPQENLWLQQIRSGESDEWTDTDDVILDHFYPNISEDALPEEEKKKLKAQIIAMIKRSMEPEDDTDPPDGIYLGTKPEISHPAPPPEEPEIADLGAKLDEFVVADFSSQKPRALLRHEVSENLLEEYGMQDYRSTVKSHDYNDSAKTVRSLDRYTAEDLHGFKIGSSLADLKQKPVPQPVRSLSSGEMEEHAERAQQAKKAQFHNQIKRKFGTAEKPSPLLEINNFNDRDARSMSVLQDKLSRHVQDDSIPDRDLDDLLGYSGQDAPVESVPDMHSLMNKGLEGMSTDWECTESHDRKRGSKKVAAEAIPSDQQFLDDLLG